VATIALIIASVAAFFLWVPEYWTTGQASSATLARYGLAPVQHPVTTYRFETLVTSLFLHSNFLHLLGNMFFLAVFGSRVEQRLGRRTFITAFAMSAAFSSMVALLAYDFPTDGAQGGISGLCGVGLRFDGRGALLLVTWLAYNYFLASTSTPGIGYWNHIGGLTVGMMARLRNSMLA